MEPKELDGKLYYPASYVAELWGYKESTIARYSNPSSGKVPGCIRRDGVLYVPVGSIRPITEPIAQGLLWGIVGIKNDPSSFLDLTSFSIDNSQLSPVLSELSRLQYLKINDKEPDLRKRLLDSQITDKGFSLIVYRARLSEEPTNKLTVDRVSLALTITQTLLQLAQAIHIL